MNTEQPLQLDPIWINAAERAHQQFTYGDLIPWEWIRTELEIEPPEDGSYQQFQELQLRTLTLMDQFRNYLLMTHRKALVNVRCQGYRIINPGQQTSFALEQLADALARHLRTTKKLLSAINFQRLTDSQISENVEARNRVAAIAAFTKPKLPRLKKD